MPESASNIKIQLSDILLREQERLKKVIAAMGFRGGDIEDVLQDVIVEALKCSNYYDEYEQAKLVLCKITINVCNKERRRHYQFKHALGDIFAVLQQTYIPSPPEEIIQRESVALIRTALENMDEGLKTVLVLKYFCDMNSGQIGEVLEIADSTVRSRLMDARLKLAIAMKGRC